MVPGWHDGLRDQVMLRALRAKFTQNKKLGRLLLGTGDKYLVEHTRRDNYWGDGGDGTGTNRLGKLLVQLRTEMRADLEAAAS